MPTWGLAAAAVVVLVLLAPSALADADTLSHLAAGRWIVEHDGIPRHDPFTFPRPAAAWSNPEWLGDLAWFGLWSVGGVAALQGAKLALLVFAGWLATRVGRVLRAPTALLLLLFIGYLPAAASTLTTRNHIHAYWLLPAFALIVFSQQRRPWLWLTLLPLGWLWANLHASFALGCLLLALLVSGRILAREPIAWRYALPALLIQPALPLFNPQGPALYRQLWDHVAGIDVYRSLLVEWKSPLESSAWLGVLPLHAFTLVLALVFPALVRERRLWGPLAGAIVGLAMAYASRRFLALPAILGGAVVAAGLRRVTFAWSPAARTRAAVGSVAIAFAYAGVAGAATRGRVRPDVLHKVHGPQDAAGFVARFAPDGARVFNSYNDGPWLLWMAAPRVRHYIDPRNNVGAAFVADYWRRLVEPAHFDAEAAAQKVTLAMFDLDDALFQPLIVHLDLSPDWTPVYLDAQRVVYARPVAENEALIKQFGYAILRARTARHDLAALSPANRNDLGEDLRRLGGSAPELGATISGCLPLLRPGERQSSDTVGAVVARLDDAIANQTYLSGILTACLAETLHRLRGPSEALEVLSNAEDEVGRDGTFRGLLVRLSGGSAPPAP